MPEQDPRQPISLNNIERESVARNRSIIWFVKTVAHNHVHKIAGFTTTFSFLLGIISLFIFAGQYLDELGGFILVILSIDILLSVIAVGVWRVGRWLRGLIQVYWEYMTPPFQFDPNNSLKEIVQGVVSGYELKENRMKVDTFVLNVAIIQLTMGVVVLVFGMILFSLVSELPLIQNGGEVTISGSVSVLSAFLSVLLGPLVGVITLGAVSFATTPSDLLLLVFTVLVPGILISVSVRNISVVSEDYHYSLFHKSISGTNTKIVEIGVIVITNTLVLAAFLYAILGEI